MAAKKYEYEVTFTRTQSCSVTVESTKKLTEDQLLAKARKEYEEEEERDALEWEEDSLDSEVSSGDLADE